MRGARAFARLADEIRRLRPDLVVDLQGLFRTGLLALTSGAARRVGLSTAREGAVWFYTDVVPVADFEAIHAVDRLWLIAKALGAAGPPKEFRLVLPDEARQWANEQLAGLPRPWLVVGPGSRWPTKRWPPEYFAALARRRRADSAGPSCSSAAATRRPWPRPWPPGSRVRRRNLAGRTSLPQLTAVLAEADVMLANDTGPLHVAAALGRPVVAPYTCTKVLLTGPYGGESGCVESRVWCQGSRLKRCRRMDCMAELTPDRLWPRLEEVLLKWESRRRSA